MLANARMHGTTYRIPWEMLAQERPHPVQLTDRKLMGPCLREDRTVAPGRLGHL